MKVAHISYADAQGGAFRAAYRVHAAQTSIGLQSRMYVVKKFTDDPNVFGIKDARTRRLHFLRERVADRLVKMFAPKDGALRSLALGGNGLTAQAQDEGCDVLNLHWVGSETIGLRELLRVACPLVWRVSDMWPFCGAEHYANDSDGARWKLGYDRTAPPASAAFDIDKLIWNRKRKYEPRKLHLVATTSYVEKCLRDSYLFRDHDITIIPNPLDISVFRPIERSTARRILGLPQDKKIVLFGAVGGTMDARKGWDLLYNALANAPEAFKVGTICVVFGQSAPTGRFDAPLAMRWLGTLRDDVTLSLAYCAADVMVVPSRNETFGQTVSEALACGTPAVAFKHGGPMDNIEHTRTGWLASPFDPLDLLRGILWVLEDPARHRHISERAREYAVDKFSYSSVAHRYQSVYRRLLG